MCSSPFLTAEPERNRYKIGASWLLSNLHYRRVLVSFTISSITITAHAITVWIVQPRVKKALILYERWISREFFWREVNIIYLWIWAACKCQAIQTWWIFLIFLVRGCCYRPDSINVSIGRDFNDWSCNTPVDTSFLFKTKVTRTGTR